ncbi:hypothetical protein EDB83DRAFT_699187 [Lactarius deliciosus]|nr:hypothetical protein EDB83DRAFT_699187 [Lactarius deliciosus]
MARVRTRSLRFELTLMFPPVFVRLSVCLFYFISFSVFVSTSDNALHINGLIVQNGWFWSSILYKVEYECYLTPDFESDDDDRVEAIALYDLAPEPFGGITRSLLVTRPYFIPYAHCPSASMHPRQIALVMPKEKTTTSDGIYGHSNRAKLQFCCLRR